MPATKTIWKFPLHVADSQYVPMPEYAQILSVQMQDGTPCLWAVCDPNAQLVERRFDTFGTGWNFEFDPTHLLYIGTYQIGSFVWHLFERI